MRRDFAAAVQDIESVLKEYADAEARKDSGEIAMVRLITLLGACIERWAPAHSEYRKPLGTPYNLGASSLGGKLAMLRGALQALGDDFRAGRMVALVELVHGQLFSDYLDMAKHLVDQGFKDPAAVIVGSTLEAHLRALCTKSSVPTAAPDGKSKKASTLNTELRSAGAYDVGDMKQVEAWLDLRNDAAHGDYAKYDHSRVALMLDGVRAFLVRLPA